MDHQALEPVLLEVKEHCSFADYFIICSGGSKRQVTALAQHLEEELAKVKIKPLGVEGMQEGLWVLMDYNTVVVHIFFQELREFLRFGRSVGRRSQNHHNLAVSFGHILQRPRAGTGLKPGIRAGVRP